MTSRSLRSYLVILVVAVAFPLLVFSLVQSVLSARLHRAAIEDGLLHTTRALAVAVENELQGSIAALHALAASTRLDSDDLAYFYEQTRRVREDQSWYSVWIADANGRQLFSLLRPYGAELPAIAERDYFQQVVKTRRPVISGLLSGRLTSGYHIAVAVPVIRDGRLKYVLVAGFKPDALSQILAAQGSGSGTGVASIVDSDYKVLARSVDEQKWIGQRGNEQYIAVIRERNEGVAKAATLDGKTVYVAFRRLPVSGWTVGVGVLSSQVDAPLHQAIWRTAILGAVFLVIAIVAAVVLGRRIAQPIAALAAAAGDIAQGRPVEVWRESRVREISALAAALGKASEATRERDQFAAELRLIFDNLREGLVTSTPQGEFVYWNPAALQMHGFATLDEARGPVALFQRVFEISTLGGEVVPFEQWPLPRILRGETVRELELTVRRLDKYWERIYSYAGGVARDADGNPRLALVSISDVTERKRAELHLRQSEEHFRLLVEQTVDGIFLSDAQGHYIDVNSAGCRMLGYTHDEITRMSIADVLAPEEIPRIEPHVKSLQGGQVVRAEWSFRRKDGTLFFGEAAARQLPDGRLQGIVRDITERKQAEAALRERRARLQELQQLHVASLTAAAIAHDLGQPLNAIASYAEAAQRMLQAGNPKPDRLAHALQSCSEQAQRAGKVVRELLQFLRERKTVTERVDLNDAVRRALSVVQAEGFAGFQATLELEPELKPVRANLLQVEKVLVNLLSNAAEAMREAGVSTSAGRVAICTRTVDGKAHVTVRDSGPGLNEANARKIFEPFYTTKHTGIGMGLAISRALIEAHGGRLWFALEPGPGATFHFEPPFAL